MNEAPMVATKSAKDTEEEYKQRKQQRLEQAKQYKLAKKQKMDQAKAEKEEKTKASRGIADVIANIAVDQTAPSDASDPSSGSADLGRRSKRFSVALEGALASGELEEAVGAAAMQG